MTISVITVVYNCVQTIEETILSVVEQSAFSSIEYIIIDGNSSDGTQALIEKYTNKISYYVSEEDKGLYDAMNKGMKVANGDFCLFLNAGDVFYSKTVISTFLNEITSLDMVYFGTAVMTDRISMYKMVPNDNSDVEAWINNGGLPNHQSMLFPKSFYSTEQYNLDFQISSDDDFKIRVLKKYPFKYINIWVVLFEMGGISSSFESWKHVKKRISEMNCLHKKYPHEPSSNRISFYKYAIKLVGIWFLTYLVGFRKSFDTWFNKYQKIAAQDIDKFKIQS